MNLDILKLALAGISALTQIIANSKPNINYNGCNIARINSYGGRDPFHPRNRINRRISKRW